MKRTMRHSEGVSAKRNAFLHRGRHSGNKKRHACARYNGGVLAAKSYTLQLAAQIETGPVPSVLPGNSFGVENYVDQAPLNVQVYVVPPGDANLDGSANCTDYSLVKAAVNTAQNSPGYKAVLDQNNDGIINVQDLVVVTQHLAKGTVCH